MGFFQLKGQTSIFFIFKNFCVWPKVPRLSDYSTPSTCYLVLVWVCVHVCLCVYYDLWVSGGWDIFPVNRMIRNKMVRVLKHESFIITLTCRLLTKDTDGLVPSDRVLDGTNEVPRNSQYLWTPTLFLS